MKSFLIETNFVLLSHQVRSHLLRDMITFPRQRTKELVPTCGQVKKVRQDCRRCPNSYQRLRTYPSSRRYIPSSSGGNSTPHHYIPSREARTRLLIRRLLIKNSW
ncbi:hypothetical protein AVEN_201168-1 [Araneus ventricosus]|uniref:Uncharacterized protein n=1 Tax=Araneus ventricosus TaxID=182803 RepID=A0A4Y2KEF6_ARAVE|nr:hypothetical protein AVEN_201168-1 [Araneus ventricosus]